MSKKFKNYVASWFNYRDCRVFRKPLQFCVIKRRVGRLSQYYIYYWKMSSFFLQYFRTKFDFKIVLSTNCVNCLTQKKWFLYLSICFVFYTKYINPSINGNFQRNLLVKFVFLISPTSLKRVNIVYSNLLFVQLDKKTKMCFIL